MGLKPFALKRLRTATCPFALTVLAALPAAGQMAYVPFGARAVAMGDAAVALPEGGAASALENPAAVGDGNLAAALSVGAAASESGDFLSPLKVVSGNSPAALAAGTGNLGDVTRALRTLAEPGNGVPGDGRAGVVVAAHGWAISETEWGWGGSFARADLAHLSAGLDPATSVLYNDSAAAFRSLLVRDLSVANARTIGGVLSVGVAVHWLRGTTSTKEESAFTTDVGDALQMARRGTTGFERTRTRFSWDAGALLSVGVLKVGGVVRGINRPEFPFEDAPAVPAADRGSTVTLGREARVGASVHVPVVGLTVAADLDLTHADTMVPGLRSREAGGGVEWALGPLALRGGLAVNLDSPDKTKRFSGGVGVGLGPVKADAAVIYRPDRSALGGVLTARVGI